MLFILRKIRRSFFLPGKVRTYMAYAAGEIVLIVVGILLALQISEWNQEREDRAEETEILVRLKAELEATKTNLTKYTERLAGVRDTVLLLLSFIEDTSSAPPEKELNRLLMNSLLVYDFTPIMSTYEEILASGNLRLIRSGSLRKKFAEISQTSIDIEETSKDLYDRWMIVEEPYMIDHLVLSEIVKNQTYAEELEIPTLPFKANPDAFRNREFANILSGRLTYFLDLRTYTKRLFNHIDQSLDLIDAELHASYR